MYRSICVTPDRRSSPRQLICVECTLSRAKGNAILGKTVDLSEGGMRVSTTRPLAIDEVVAFDLSLETGDRHGQARVLRQTGHDTYALRFEQAA